MVIYVHHLDDPYIRGFPLLFHVLKGLDRLFAETLLTGRVLAAVCGVVSVGLTYACFRSFVGRPPALLAALLLALNLGHLFWSQSARYYTGVLVLEVVASWGVPGRLRTRPAYLSPAGQLEPVRRPAPASVGRVVPASLRGLRADPEVPGRAPVLSTHTPHLLAFGIPCLLNAALLRRDAVPLPVGTTVMGGDPVRPRSVRSSSRRWPTLACRSWCCRPSPCSWGIACTGEYFSSWLWQVACRS